MGKRLKLGGRDRHEGYIHLDRDPNVKPEICRDVLRGIPRGDNEFDVVFLDNFLEHMPPGEDSIFIINEVWRVLKPGGVMRVFSPEWDYDLAIYDPTHLSFWKAEKFTYFCGVEGTFEYELAPAYGITALFDWEDRVVTYPIEGFFDIELKAIKEV
jgi:SAM-dependent methyltransferase